MLVCSCFNLSSVTFVCTLSTQHTQTHTKYSQKCKQFKTTDKAKIKNEGEKIPFITVLNSNALILEVRLQIVVPEEVHCIIMLIPYTGSMLSSVFITIYFYNSHLILIMLCHCSYKPFIFFIRTFHIRALKRLCAPRI